MTYDSEMTALADAIRSKANITETLTVSGMRAAVADLSVGGGISPDVRTLFVTPSKSQQNFTSSELGANAYYGTVTVEPIPSEYITTDDATAVSGDILAGKTAYVKGEKVTGTLQIVTATLSGNVVTVPPGVITEAQTLTVPEAQALTISENTVTVYSGYIRETQTVTVGTAKGAETFTPGTSDITIPADTYLTGAQLIRGDGALTPENIKTGVTIFDVEGTFTADATAVRSDILPGKTAYIKGAKVTGTMPRGTIVQNGAKVTVTAGYVPDGVLYIGTAWSEYFGFDPIVPGTDDRRIDAGFYMDTQVTVKGDANLVPGNIAAGVSIFNVEGTFTADADATTADIVEGRTAYVNGRKITGLMKEVTATLSGNVVTIPRGLFAEDQTITVGTAKGAEIYTPGTADITIPADTYLAGVQTIKGDANFTEGNIAEGVTMWGKTGTHKGGTDTSDATATADDILMDKTAYVNGEKVTGTMPFSTLDFNAGSFTVSRGYTAEDTVYDVPIMTPPTIDDNVVVVQEGYNNESFEVTVGNAIEGGFFIPGTSNIVIPKQSYLLNNYVIMGDSNLAAENIKTGVTIFEVVGTFTSDADATASDIASGKTAYVNGAKIVGTKKDSGGIIPLWDRYYARLFGSVKASSFVQTPTSQNGYGDQFFVVDGKLMYKHLARYDSPLIVDTSAEWTWAKWADPGAENGMAIAIAGNSFYVVESIDTGSEGSSDPSGFRLPSMTVKCVVSDLPGPITGAVSTCCWGNHVFSMNGGLFIADDNRYAHVAYKREHEDDPFVYVSVGKLLPERVNGVSSYYFLTSSGDIACVEWESGRVNMDSGRVDWAENETLAEGNPFVNYKHLYYYDDWAENGTYELAIRSDGNMWFRVPGWENTWSKVYTNGEDVKFIATNELGYCDAQRNEEIIEDPDTGEPVEYYTATHYTQALHIDTQGRAWRIRSAFSGSSFTGVEAILIDDSTDWQCVPPCIERNKVYYVQKGGKLYRTKVYNDMVLKLVEDPVQPSGKLVCSDTVDANLSVLWFAPEDAVVDMSHSGGTYTM